MTGIEPYLKAVRPKQWAKNIIIFAALVFDGQLTHLPALLKTFLGFLILCLLNGGIYLFNDIIDIDADRNHPQKKNRPIAAGQIPLKNAWIFAGVLIIAACFAAYTLEKRFFYLLLIILATNIVYTLYLKRQPLIDVIVIGLLFLMRVFAGVTLIQVKVFSPWLYIVTFMLSLYLGFGKRRSELSLVSQDEGETRQVLSGYTLALLDQLITIVSSVTIMAYSLYTFSGPTLPGNNLMLLTIPIVVYGIFRYHYLIQVKNAGGAPEEILMTDRPLQAAILLYIALVCFALYA